MLAHSKDEPVPWIFPLQHQLCIQRVERRGHQISSSVESHFGHRPLPHSSAQSGATQIKAVTGRFPQSETRPNLTVTRHLEAGIHLVLAGRGALGGLARGTVGSIGVP